MNAGDIVYVLLGRVYHECDVCLGAFVTVDGAKTAGAAFGARDWVVGDDEISSDTKGQYDQVYIERHVVAL